MATIDKSRMSKVATDLVFRARHGDQNAMGMIAEVRKAAHKSGKFGAENLRAKMAFKMIQEAVRRNPKGKANLGAEAAAPTPPALPPKQYNFPKELLTGLICPESFFECFKAFQHIQNGMLIVCTMMSFGPTLTKANFREFMAGVPNDAQGRCVVEVLNNARKIQAVRNPNLPNGILSPVVAWEMGE